MTFHRRWAMPVLHELLNGLSRRLPDFRGVLIRWTPPLVAGLLQVSTSPNLKIRALKLKLVLTTVHIAFWSYSTMLFLRLFSNSLPSCTGQHKENLDMMFTKVIIREDIPLNIGESTFVHDSLLEVSKRLIQRNNLPKPTLSSDSLIRWGTERGLALCV
jgi:hypothetical protein